MKGGFCKTIFSTPKGILTDRQAIKEKVGGEVLFKIW
jgi:ribosomal protein S8